MATNSSFYFQPNTPPAQVETPAPTSFYKDSGRAYPTNSSAEENLNLLVSIAGAPLLPNEWLFGHIFDVPIVFAANLDGSAAVAGVAATGTPALVLSKNGVPFGTLTYAGKTGTFSCPQTAFVVGDLFEVVAPATLDPTLQHLSISFYGTR